MKKENIVLALGIGGLTFAGYLAGVKFFTETCAFNESCPYFLGLPACYYGFFMYFIITLAAVLRHIGRVSGERAERIILTTSGVGIGFAGYFTVIELPLFFEKGITAYMLGLPTCALGLIFYVAIFMLTKRST